jgi:hypothetical protein
VEDLLSRGNTTEPYRKQSQNNAKHNIDIASANFALDRESKTLPEGYPQNIQVTSGLPMGWRSSAARPQSHTTRRLALKHDG